MKRIILLVWLAVFLGLPSAPAPRPLPSSSATLIDGTGAAPRPDVTIVMANGRIAAIGPVGVSAAACRRPGCRCARQVRGARHHQHAWARRREPRSAAASVRALRRDDDYEHGDRSRRHRRIQGAPAARRSARRADSHGEVALYDSADRAILRQRRPKRRGRASTSW